MSVASDVPEWVLGDSGRLRQVLLNLVGNAIKFTDAGRVTCCVEMAGSVADWVELRFVVKDTGIGIAADRQQVIFDAFTQADTSISRRFGGTGLGLAISSRLVKLAGGRIQIDSAPAWAARSPPDAIPEVQRTLKGKRTRRLPLQTFVDPGCRRQSGQSATGFRAADQAGP